MARTNVFRVVTVLVGLLVTAQALYADQLITFRNGLTVRGRYAEVASLNLNSFSAGGAGGGQARPIWMIDDGIRRTYVHRGGMVKQDPIAIADLSRTIEFEVSEPLGSASVASIGQLFGVSPWDDYGRRRVDLRDEKGKRTTVHQGIESINGRYAIVKGLRADPGIKWDMRIATSSLSDATLNRIFQKRLDQNNFDERIEVVQFFVEANRFAAAHAALIKVIKDFPGERELAELLISFTESQFSQLIDEAKFRALAGQPRFAESVLEKIPLAKVGRVTRLKVQDELVELRKPVEDGQRLVAGLRQLIADMQPEGRAAVSAAVDEIEAGLSADTLSRLSDYARFVDSNEVPSGNKLALAIAGWILGSGSGEQNLKVALSLVEVRDLVREYIGVANAGRRAAILERLRTLEGAQPEYVEKLLPLIEPQLSFPPESADQKIPGMYRIGVDTDNYPIRDGSPSYSIQLPPEYNPLRSYPCIVALHTVAGRGDDEVDWWAGPYSEQQQTRIGQASRQGYIVVSPNWTRQGQRHYEYTGREHHQVLAAVRDAMRRASIDSDRVFITGHGDGGTAAWDIALSNADLWAGLITIGATPDKTILHYDQNAIGLPVYFVMGAMDGNPLKSYGAELDDYMGYKHDAMVVMYRGRGREFFYEEQPYLFEWMGQPAHTRRATPDEIDSVTIREGDRTFWWVDLDEVLPTVAIDPVLWGQAKRLRAGEVSCRVGEGNKILVRKVPSERLTVRLRPDMGIDMNSRITITHRKTKAFEFDGNLDGMLEDVRRRADRKRPFWASVTLP